MEFEYQAPAVSVSVGYRVNVKDAPDAVTGYNRKTTYRPALVEVTYHGTDAKQGTPTIRGRRVLKSGELGADVSEWFWFEKEQPEWLAAVLAEIDRRYREDLASWVAALRSAANQAP